MLRYHYMTHGPQSCCVAAASLSRTRDLETLLAPLATVLVETNLPNEASVDCVAFLLQVCTIREPIFGFPCPT